MIRHVDMPSCLMQISYKRVLEELVGTKVQHVMDGIKDDLETFMIE